MATDKRLAQEKNYIELVLATEDNSICYPIEKRKRQNDGKTKKPCGNGTKTPG